MKYVSAADIDEAVISCSYILVNKLSPADLGIDELHIY